MTQCAFRCIWHNANYCIASGIMLINYLPNHYFYTYFFCRNVTSPRSGFCLMLPSTFPRITALTESRYKVNICSAIKLTLEEDRPDFQSCLFHFPGSATLNKSLKSLSPYLLTYNAFYNSIFCAFLLLKKFSVTV